MLNKANVDDGMISRGVRLTQVGMQKVADRYHIGLDQVPVMLTSLASEKLTEDVDRYSYETDIMGNVTIRDSEAGSEKFLSGERAFRLVDQLKAHPENGQRLIADYFGNHELTESLDSDQEIISNQGSFNFPYRGMLATSEFGLDRNGIFRVNVASLRDKMENEIDITPEMREELNKISMKWVDRV